MQYPQMVLFVKLNCGEEYSNNLFSSINFKKNLFQTLDRFMAEVAA